MAMAHVAILIPYRHFFPPRNGGQLRCFYLLRELAREHQVHAIILQPEEELRQPTGGYQFPASVRVYGPAQTPPPRSVFDWLPGRLGLALHYRWLQRSWRGPANSVLLETHHLIRHILTRHDIDVVILTTLSSICVASLVKRVCPQAIRILNTENIEHHLLAQAVGGDDGVRREGRAWRRNYLRTCWYESHLARFVHTFFACSDEDRETLASLNRGELKGFVVPNGVDTSARPFDGRADKGQSRELLFCGSLNHPPNREGLLWFHGKIWSLIAARHPGLRLVVIGRGPVPGTLAPLQADPRVDLVGEVDDVVPYYHRTGISVVPLRTGSGTRLKVLEAMSLGNPVVSTSLGAQGIEAVDREHLLLADEPTQFAEAVERLLSDAGLFERMRRSARTFVEQTYDWQVVGQTMSRAIDSLLIQSELTLS